jgi:hypothetical protein
MPRLVILAILIGLAVGGVPAQATARGQRPAGSLKDDIPYHGPQPMTEVKELVARAGAEQRAPP